jgi:RimJ/RimL family protein N-acetyltransferase
VIRTELQIRPPAAAPVPDAWAIGWRGAVPVLAHGEVTLREVRFEDGPSLLEMLVDERVRRFVSPPPTTLGGFERFILWAHHGRAAGRFVCFGIVPAGESLAIGIVQVRAIAPAFAVAEGGSRSGTRTGVEAFSPMPPPRS